jgi:hypothetical protein
MRNRKCCRGATCRQIERGNCGRGIYGETSVQQGLRTTCKKSRVFGLRVADTEKRSGDAKPSQTRLPLIATFSISSRLLSRPWNRTRSPRGPTSSTLHWGERLPQRRPKRPPGVSCGSFPFSLGKESSQRSEMATISALRAEMRVLRRPVLTIAPRI